MNTLRWMGTNGPAVLFFGSLVGLCFPLAADWMQPCMSIGVWMFTFGAFAKTNFAEFRASTRHPAALGFAIVGSIVLAPLIASALSTAFGFSPELSAGLALAAAAPPSGAAVVAMLGLDVSLAVFLMVFAVLLSPLTFPWLASAFGVAVNVDPTALASRIAWLTLPPAVLAFSLKCAVPKFVNRNGIAATGMASLGLLVVAMGAMKGIQSKVLADPAEAAEYLALAFAFNLLLQGVGLVASRLFAKLGRRDALTMGVCYGNRNVSLASVAASDFLVAHQASALYVAMSFLPIFILPQLQTLWFAMAKRTGNSNNTHTSPATISAIATIQGETITPL